MYALREEDDILENQTGRWPRYFYPRPPRGGRQAALVLALAILTISIHALREEGDRCATRRSCRLPIFLSTPSARRATRLRQASKRTVFYFYPRPPRGGRLLDSQAAWSSAGFLSTPSARRATCHSGMQPHPCNDFYPRPPRGGRHVSVEFDVKCTNISIHALREEGDCPVRVGDLRDIEISIHALREEGDYRLPAIPHRQLISIHALREEGDHVSPS